MSRCILSKQVSIAAIMILFLISGSMIPLSLSYGLIDLNHNSNNTSTIDTSISTGTAPVKKVKIQNNGTNDIVAVGSDGESHVIPLRAVQTGGQISAAKFSLTPKDVLQVFQGNDIIIFGSTIPVYKVKVVDLNRKITELVFTSKSDAGNTGV